MKFTLGQIAGMLGADLVGDPSVEVSTVAKIEEGHAGSISFLANPKYVSYIYTTDASAVLVARDFEPQAPIKSALLRVDDPYSAFTALLEQADRFMRQSKRGVDERSFVAASAKVGEGVYIGAFAYVGENAVIADGVAVYPNSYVGDFVKIGRNSTLYPNVTVYQRCEIGESCVLHAGAVLGSDGFGFAPQADGSYRKVPQLGNVVLGNEVEIGANTVIDRATMGSTRVADGVKLDNLIQIAHNVEIGKNTVIAAQTGISGSTKLGQQCMIGGQVGIVGHLRIASGTKLGAGSGVAKNITEEGQSFRGAPIQPYNRQLRTEVLVRQLIEMEERLKALEKIAGKNAEKNHQ